MYSFDVFDALWIFLLCKFLWIGQFYDITHNGGDIDSGINNGHLGFNYGYIGMNNSQALYDLIMTFLEQNPDTSLVEVMGIFEIIKIQQYERVANELNQDEIEE